MPIVNSLVSWYLKRRLPAFEEILHNPEQVQNDQLIRLLRTAQITEFGRKYDFKSIQNMETFKERVPVTNYDDFKHYIERMMQGEQNILWPSEVSWFAKSSGTTSAKSKFIPVTYESLEECHYQGGKDLLMTYLIQKPESEIFAGKGLVMGGSHQINNANSDSFYGDVSAVMMQNLPLWAQYLRTPDLSIAIMDNWDSKIEKMAQATINDNVTNISGVPTWTIVLIEKLFELSGKNNLTDIWPNLELYVHGGVSFTPYKDRFKQLIKNSQVNYLETYNASEGFLGIQDRLGSDDMLLMLDYGIFFEFMPMSEYGKDFPITYSLSEVKPNENYALVISTNSGLWRYIIGDTIKFTSVHPFRFKITGRTKHFINAFGEELVIENADFAIKAACEKTEALLNDYTAAPIYFTEHTKGGHEWLIEFEREPNCMNTFVNTLDQTLKQQNSDYEAKRYKDMAMLLPKLNILPKGTFQGWLKQAGKLGGQHKVPRLSNHRTFVDDILQMQKAQQQSIV
ncbi:MAG: GH3 auxin-responsive promoter family protein [Bacteroidia bacterium]|nr:GH3 auxin-responsive promoter family protein [Bacteroidia bacterium]MCF8446788.1 GH3 auxin-responsive promoter family protein [Bacteroidia bacterium]